MTDKATAKGILLALDLSPESLAAAKLAVEVAAALGQEIEALFVEDRELLDLADHPLARQVDLFGTRIQPVERARVERSLRAQAARARALLGDLAAARGIAWSFRVVRGTVIDEIRAASLKVGTVTVGRIGWSQRSRTALGSTTQAVLIEGECRVLVPGRRPSVSGPVVACYAGSPSGGRVLAAAVQLAKGMRAPLRVEVVARDPGKLAALQEEAEAQLADSGVEAAFHTRAVARLSELVASLGVGPCGFLVVPAGALGGGHDLISLVSDLDCPLLLIR